MSLTSFYGFGKDYVEAYYNKYKHAVFLHLRRIKHELPTTPEGDGPEKKITRLAIGVEGGFDSDAGKRKFEYEDIYNVVVLPDFKTFEWPNSNLPEKVILATYFM